MLRDNSKLRFRFEAILVIAVAFAVLAGVQPVEAGTIDVYMSGPGYGSTAYSIRVELGSPHYSFMMPTAANAPYTFKMTNPVVKIEPYSPGHKTQFRITALKVGQSVVTITDAKGNTATREIVVYENKPQPLTLNISPEPVAVGQGRGIGVSGGTPPYKVVSANPGIARIEAGSAMFFVWGVAAGSAQITVTDAKGAVVQGTAVIGTTKPLNISAPTTILQGGTDYLYISSGNPPYTVTSSANLSVTYKNKDSYGRDVYLITGGSPGSATITVRDGKGLSQSRTITVAGYVTITLANREIDVSQSTTATVTGGAAPYTVTAGTAGMVDLKDMGGGRYTVTGIKPGVVWLYATDKNGQKRDISLTVKALPTLTLTAPASLTVGGPTGTLSFIGGAAPFTVTASGNQVRLTKLEEKRYTITPVAAGTVTITVGDGKQQTVSKTLTVLPKKLQAGITSNTFNLTGIIGRTRTLSVWGGQGPYQVTSSSPVVTIYHQGKTMSGSDAFMVTASRQGAATLSIRDAGGQLVKIDIVVLQ